MRQADLIRAAQGLRPVAPEAAREFAEKREGLAMALTQRMLARPDLERLVGVGNADMMQNDSRNMTRFLATMYEHLAPETLVETVLWVFRAYRSHGFQVTFWAANLDTLLEALREQTSPAAYRDLSPLVEWLIVHVPAFTALSDQQLGSASPDPRAPRR
jgi:hypothetical protein